MAAALYWASYSGIYILGNKTILLSHVNLLFFLHRCTGSSLRLCIPAWSLWWFVRYERAWCMTSCHLCIMYILLVWGGWLRRVLYNLRSVEGLGVLRRFNLIWSACVYGEGLSVRIIAQKGVWYCRLSLAVRVVVLAWFWSHRFDWVIFVLSLWESRLVWPSISRVA